ncbi:MAG: DUF4116 domain-containing protein [Bacteroidota bacterium]
MATSIEKQGEDIHFCAEAEGSMKRSGVNTPNLPIISEAISLDDICSTPSKLKNIPPNKVTERLLILALERNSRVVQHIPIEFARNEIVIEAVKRAFEGNMSIYKIMPIWFRNDKEMAEKAVESDGSFWKFVPERLQTQELAKKAFKKTPWIWIEIAIELRSVDMHVKALTGDSKYWDSISDEKKFENYPLWYAFVNARPSAFKDAPNIVKRENMCKVTLKKNGMFWEYLPNSQKTLKNFKIAFKQNPQVINLLVPRSEYSHIFDHLALEGIFL